MICPCKGCEDRTITCHGVCKRYQEWKAWIEERNRKMVLDRTNREISHDQEMKYRRNLKAGKKAMRAV